MPLLAPCSNYWATGLLNYDSVTFSDCWCWSRFCKNRKKKKILAGNLWLSWHGITQNLIAHTVIYNQTQLAFANRNHSLDSSFHLSILNIIKYLVGGAHCPSARGARQRTRGAQLFSTGERQNPHILGNHQKTFGREEVWAEEQRSWGGGGWRASPSRD